MNSKKVIAIFLSIIFLSIILYIFIKNKTYDMGGYEIKLDKIEKSNIIEPGL